MWITWCISPLFPRKPENENVDNFHRTDGFEEGFHGRKWEKVVHFVKGGVCTGKRVRKSGKNNWHFLWELTENSKINEEFIKS